jgi:hypothetical protein
MRLDPYDKLLLMLLGKGIYLASDVTSSEFFWQFKAASRPYILIGINWEGFSLSQ